MEIQISEKQLINFLKRRWDADDFKRIVSDVKDGIDRGETLNDAIHDGINPWIESKIQDEFGYLESEGEYWELYRIYEIPLVIYVKSKLNLK